MTYTNYKGSKKGSQLLSYDYKIPNVIFRNGNKWQCLLTLLERRDLLNDKKTKKDPNEKR